MSKEVSSVKTSGISIHIHPCGIRTGGHMSFFVRQAKISLSGHFAKGIRPGSHPNMFCEHWIMENPDAPGTENPHPFPFCQILHPHTQIFRVKCAAVLKSVEDGCQCHSLFLIHFCQTYPAVIFIHTLISSFHFPPEGRKRRFCPKDLSALYGRSFFIIIAKSPKIHPFIYGRERTDKDRPA